MTKKELTLGRAERKARVVALVVQLFELLCPDRDEPEVYSTESPEHWPPRARSRRHARDLIRECPGHERHGRGRETVWTIVAEDYRVHRSSRPLAKAKAAPSEPASIPTSANDDEIASRALESVPLRSTRRAG